MESRFILFQQGLAPNNKMVVCTLLGALLGISSSTYYKGLGKGIYTDGEGGNE